jgi:hypothetical protein
VKELQDLVAGTSDGVGLHAPAPTLLLELQTLLGALTASATAASDRGRRPFRPEEGWGRALGELAFALFNLADQTDVDLAGEIRAIAADLSRDRAPGPDRPGARGA